MKRINIPEPYYSRLKDGEVLSFKVDGIPVLYGTHCLQFQGQLLEDVGLVWPESWLEDVEEALCPNVATCEGSDVGCCSFRAQPEEWGRCTRHSAPKQTHTLTPDELPRVKVDAPVEIARMGTGPRTKGHFAFCAGGGVATVWDFGHTSHTGTQYSTQPIRIPQSHNPAAWREENLEKNQ